MKPRRLPPLNPLRNFEAAGRLGGFTRAAIELNVTPAAVSRQIGVLEDYLGRRLFERRSNTITLTAAGHDFLPAATTALDIVNDSVSRLRREPGEALVICTYQPLAMRWLIPRLPRFFCAHPDIDINLTTAIKPEEFDYTRIDIGLQHGNVCAPQIDVHPILPDVVVPVCTPQLATGARPLPPARNLECHTFLHSRYRRMDWIEWLDVAGVGGVSPRQQLTFKGSGLTNQAAVEGLGIAAGQRLLVDDEIQTGRLVMPFDTAMQRPHGICMVSRHERLRDSRVRAFRSWLVQEAATTLDGLGLAQNTLELDAPQAFELAPNV